MEPEGCSESNHRPRPIQPRAAERLRNAHLDAGNRPSERGVATAHGTMPAMTRTPTAPHAPARRPRRAPRARRRLRPRPPPPPPRPPTAAPSTSAPTASPSARPSVAPTLGRGPRLVRRRSRRRRRPPPASSRRARTPTTRTPRSTTPIESRSRTSAACGATARSSATSSTGPRCAPTSVERRSTRQPARARPRHRGPVQGARPHARRTPRCETSTSSCSRARSPACTTTTTKKMYVVSRPARSAPSEKFTYTHEYTHALHDQAFDLARSWATRPTRATGRSPDRARRGRRDPADDALGAAAPAPRPSCSRSPAPRDPASQAVLDRMPAILKDPLLFPYTSGLNAVARRLPVGGRLRRRRRPVRQPAGLDRAGHPPREARGARGAGRGRVPRRPRRRGSATAGRSAPGHVRRDPAADHPPRRGRRDARRPSRRGRLGRRPGRADRGPGRRDAASSSTPRGTRRPTPPSSRRRSRTIVPKLEAAAAAPSILRPSPDRVVL